jgi:hypothetical protein
MKEYKVMTQKDGFFSGTFDQNVARGSFPAHQAA